VADRLPALGAQAAYLKQAMRDRLFEHKRYIVANGDDLPEIRAWRWGQKAAEHKRTSTEGDNA